MRNASLPIVLTVVAPLVWGAAGCSQSTPPTSRHSNADHEAGTDLSAWWSAERRWSLLVPQENGKASAHQGHPRIVQPWGREEGALIGRRARPLSDYLDPRSDRPDRPRFDWPEGGSGYFLEFDPPMREWPVRCDEDEAIVEHGEARAYGGDGIPFASGKVTRRVAFDGFERVQIGEQSFDRCAVLRAETKMRLGWWLTLTLRERIWLSREAGLLRRVEQIKGTALLFLSLSADRTFERDRPQRTRRTSADTLTAGRRWARAAFYLDPVYPRPRLQGLIVEWAEPMEGLPKRAENARAGAK